jgi:hypothetical protein
MSSSSFSPVNRAEESTSGVRTALWQMWQSFSRCAVRRILSPDGDGSAKPV